MKEYEQKIKLKFRFLATFYDMFDKAFALDNRGSPREGLAKKLPNEHLRVLDVATGTANSAIALATANQKNEIIGIDLSPKMIALANHKIHTRDINNITTQMMDARKTNFNDNEFDVVMVSFALHEMDYEMMLDVLIEMHRVLKNSGTLYIIDYDNVKGSLKKIAFSIYLKIFEPSHMPQFLSYNWSSILKTVGFTETNIDPYIFSKLITAQKL